MGLFRTSSHSDAYVQLLKLVSSPHKANALCKAHYPKSTLFYNYESKLPVDQDTLTRFGYLGCPVRPLYLCEMESTTLYEYAYWVLKNPDEVGLGLRAYTYELDMEKTNNYIDVEQLPNKSQIMDVRDVMYSNAHSYMKSLSKLPDYIRYCSIRNPAIGGINFAYFYGDVTAHSIKKILTINLSDTDPLNEVRITDHTGFSQIIRPIRT